MSSNTRPSTLPARPTTVSEMADKKDQQLELASSLPPVTTAALLPSFQPSTTTTTTFVTTASFIPSCTSSQFGTIPKSSETVLVSWVYNLKKHDLIHELEKRHLDTTGTSKDLRERLTIHLRTPDATPTEVTARNFPSAVENLPTSLQGTTEASSLFPHYAINQPTSVDAIGNILEMIGLPPSTDVRALRERLADLTKKEKILAHETFLQSNPSSFKKAFPAEYYDEALPPRSNHTRSEHYHPPTATNLPESSPNTSTPSLCNTVRKWNLKFDGRIDPVSFIERLNELLEAYEIPANQILKALPEIFKGNALLWWRNNRDQWRNFDDFSRDFELQYLPPGYYRNLDREIQERTQGEKETCREYVVALSTLIRRRGNFNMETKLERLYQNLKPNYKFYIRRNDVMSVAHLISRAEEYETTLRDQALYRPPPSPAQSMTPETAYQSGHLRKVNFRDPVFLQELHPAPSDQHFRKDTPGQHHQSRPAETKDFPRRYENVRRNNQEEPRETQRNSFPSNTTHLPRKPFICWNCNQEGHLFRDCVKPRTVRCFYCKREGQWTTTCQCRQGNENPTPRKGRLESRSTH